MLSCRAVSIMTLKDTKRYDLLIVSKAGHKEPHRYKSPKRDGAIRPFVLLYHFKVMAKDFAKAFYSSKRWQDCRNEYAKSVHHLCENCLRKGIYRPGVIVHHIEELTPMNIHRPEVALNFDNLELLCRECHAEQHMERSKGRRYVFGDGGEIIIK